MPTMLKAARAEAENRWFAAVAESAPAANRPAPKARWPKHRPNWSSCARHSDKKATYPILQEQRGEEFSPRFFDAMCDFS